MSNTIKATVDGVEYTPVESIITGGKTIDLLVQGGAGLTLLASGEYVHENDTANLTIPVTYSGTPKMFLVYVPTPIDGVGQAVMCAKWLDIGESATQTYMLGDSGFWVYVNRKDSGSLDRACGTQTSIPMLTNNQIQLYRSNATCQHKANTYKWFIWGEEE